MALVSNQVQGKNASTPMSLFWVFY